MDHTIQFSDLIKFMPEKNNNTIDPTLAIYGAIQFAYDFFNKKLFNSALPQGVITFHRQRKVMGYASFQRWKSPNGKRVDEIAINPEYFDDYPLIEIFQTICHEMTHLWQAHFGNPGRRGYHNKQWAEKMKEIGLMPSSTGAPGGNETGEYMMDYVLLDGPFMKSCQELINDGFGFPWVDCFPVVRLEVPVVAYRKDSSSPVELNRSFLPKAKRKKDYDEANETVLANSSELAARDIFDQPGTELPWETNAVIPKRITDFHSTIPIPKSGRIKYSCPTCHANVWGKPGLNISCNDCDCIEFQAIT